MKSMLMAGAGLLVLAACTATDIETEPAVAPAAPIVTAETVEAPQMTPLSSFDLIERTAIFGNQSGLKAGSAPMVATSAG